MWAFDKDMMDDSQDRTVVDDLPLAAYLVGTGHKLQDIEPHPSKSGLSRFIFNNDNKTVGAIMGFYGRKTMVEPRQYLSTIRRLKQESGRKWNLKAKSKN